MSIKRKGEYDYQVAVYQRENILNLLVATIILTIGWSLALGWFSAYLKDGLVLYSFAQVISISAAFVIALFGNQFKRKYKFTREKPAILKSQILYTTAFTLPWLPLVTYILYLLLVNYPNFYLIYEVVAVSLGFYNLAAFTIVEEYDSYRYSNDSYVLVSREFFKWVGWYAAVAALLGAVWFGASLSIYYQILGSIGVVLIPITYHYSKRELRNGRGAD